MVVNTKDFEPIGYIESGFKFKNGTPRQACVCGEARGRLTITCPIYSFPQHSLEGLEQFSHVWIIFVFHQNNNPYTKPKVKPPRLDGAKVGVFSTRSPYRLNPIGLTLAKVERIEGATLHVSGVDMLDGTPVLDIKPYIPLYDQPIAVRQSGIESSPVLATNNATGDDLQLRDKYPHCEKDTDKMAASGGDGTEENASHNKSSQRKFVQGADRLLIQPFSATGGTTNHMDIQTDRLRCDKSGQEGPQGECLLYQLTADSGSEPCPQQASLTELSPPFQNLTVETEQRTDQTADQHLDYSGSQGQPAARTSSATTSTQDAVGKVEHLLELASGSKPEMLTSDGVSEANQSCLELRNEKLPQTDDCSLHGDEGSNSPKDILSAKEGTGATREKSSGHSDIISCKSNESNEEPSKYTGSSNLDGAVSYAGWIAAPPFKRLQVLFTPYAEERLAKFSPDAVEEKFRLTFTTSSAAARAAITNILEADPRSAYRRQKCVDRLYFFMVDVMHVTCWFDDDRGVAEVVRVKPNQEKMRQKLAGYR